MGTHMKQKMTIVKIGGALLEDPARLQSFCQAFTDLGGQKVLVHGGGQRASELSRRLGHPPQMVDGRRITDAHALEVAVMVYAGWANKTLVARLQALGCHAIGLSGADADIIRATRRPVAEVDFGWVGDVERVSGERLSGLLDQGLVPVLCALTHDGQGHMLNTNADTIAAEVAISLSQDTHCTLMYCFDKPGVLTDIRDEKSLLPSLDRETCERLQASGAIATGMLPKLHNGFRALQEGVKRVQVGAPSMLNPGHDTFTALEL